MKWRANFVFLLTITFVLGSCATLVKHNTPSGRPEVVISGKVGKQVQSEIMNLMLNNRYNVKSSTDNLLVFERPIENVLTAVLLGSKYDSTPAARITFNIIEMADSTRVVASFTAVTNPGSAFERITPMNNHADTANYQMRLNEIKERIEMGK